VRARKVPKKINLSGSSKISTAGDMFYNADEIRQRGDRIPQDVGDFPQQSQKEGLLDIIAKLDKAEKSGGLDNLADDPDLGFDDDDEDFEEPDVEYEDDFDGDYNAEAMYDNGADEEDHGDDEDNAEGEY
jgi:hypothetical protein